MATTTTAVRTDEGGIANFASGYFTSDGNATIIGSTKIGAVSGPGGSTAVLQDGLGFTPRFVRVYNRTDNLLWEWYEGTAATETFLTTGSSGVISVTTNSDILVAANSLTLSATLVGSSKAIKWVAWG